MLVGVYIMGRLMHWMALNFGPEPTVDQCVVTAAYIATPLFLVGITALYPVLWINMLAGLVAVGYTVYLLYTGIPNCHAGEQGAGFPVCELAADRRSGHAGLHAGRDGFVVGRWFRTGFHPRLSARRCR